MVNYIYNDGGRLDAQIKSLETQIKANIKQKDDLIKNLKTQLIISFENYSGALESKKEVSDLSKDFERYKRYIQSSTCVWKSQNSRCFE